MKLPIPFSNPATYAGHSGVDYGQPRGAIIRASGPGTVVTRSRNSAGGFYIWVLYDGFSRPVGYHHMDSHNGCPDKGERVGLGSRLGYVGNSGRSTGPHLHSEVSGLRTTAGYWSYFDPNRVVGTTPAGDDIDIITESEQTMKLIFAKGIGHALVGGTVFQPLSALAAQEESVLWGSPEVVSAYRYKRYKQRAESRRKEAQASVAIDYKKLGAEIKPASGPSVDQIVAGVIAGIKRLVFTLTGSGK